MEELIVQVQRAYGEFERSKIDFALLTLHCLFMDQTTTLSNTWERRHCCAPASTLPVSIVTIATALEVFDMLERGGKLVVNKDKVVKNNRRDQMPL
jgi:hypothetical protein